MAEKFSVFTEKGSGVNPFYLPPTTPSTRALAPLNLLRCLHLVFTLPLLLLADAAAGLLDDAMPAAATALRQLLCRPLAALVLLSMGLPSLLREARKEAVALRPPAARAADAPPPRRAGELLLVNSCSYLDGFVLLALRGAGMALLLPSGELQRVTLLQALARSFRAGAPPRAPPRAAAASPGAALAALADAGPWAVLAVQPEGAPTNGKALLRLGAGAGALALALAALPPPQQPRLRVQALHYVAAGAGAFSPCFLGGQSPWWHLYCLVTRADSCASFVHALPAGFDPLPADFPEATRRADWPAAVVHAWEQLLRQQQVRGVGSDAADHERFLDMALGLKPLKAE
jgi:hypothetical protein